MNLWTKSFWLGYRKKPLLWCWFIPDRVLEKIRVDKSACSNIRAHMHKVIHEKEGIHSMPYGYFLNKMSRYFRVVGTKRILGTVKLRFSLTTLVENKCIKGKMGNCIQVQELLTAQENLRKEIKEMSIKLITKYVR